MGVSVCGGMGRMLRSSFALIDKLYLFKEYFLVFVMKSGWFQAIRLVDVFLLGDA